MDKIIIGNKLGKTKIEIAKSLSTKMNFIIGANSNRKKDINLEVKKINLAAKLDVNTITDLSMVRLKNPLWRYVKEKYPHIGV